MDAAQATLPAAALDLGAVSAAAEGNPSATGSEHSLHWQNTSKAAQ